jgi:two-component system sensor histidine kinase ChvG
MTPPAVGRGWRASRIALRLLAFNVLVLFVPVVGMLYLPIYEARLLDAQERSMVQQARIFAAALGGGEGLDPASAQTILNRLGKRSDARLRVFDTGGVLIADSTRAADQQPEDELAGRKYVAPSGVRQRTLYRVGVVLERMRSWMTSAVRLVRPAGRDPGPLDQPGALDAELQAALAGRYGAATRRTWGQRSLTLFTAVPVRHDGAVTGAVVVSQSTFRILQALYEVRLRVFQIVVASLGVAALLTTVAAMTIVRPLARLRRAAAAVSARRGPVQPHFPGADRQDEIGELARALEELTRRLSEHVTLVEGFAADVSHEFKNPLAAIRSAAEIIDDCDDPAERKRFVGMMVRDVQRLERLVSGLRELARIDGELEHGRATVVDLPDIVRAVTAGAQATAPETEIRLDVAGRCFARADGDAIVHVFENLLSNAISFAPPGTAVEVRVRHDRHSCRVSVADRGPGIPEAHLTRLFDRFFTYRPDDSRRTHLGLGLAIAKRIVEGHGGTITVQNRPGGGALFEVSLPAGPGPSR